MNHFLEYTVTICRFENSINIVCHKHIIKDKFYKNG